MGHRKASSSCDTAASYANLYPVVQDLSELEYSNDISTSSAPPQLQSPTSVAATMQVGSRQDSMSIDDCCCYAGDNLLGTFGDFSGCYLDDDDDDHLVVAETWSSSLRDWTYGPLVDAVQGNSGTLTDGSEDSKTAAAVASSRAATLQPQPSSASSAMPSSIVANGHKKSASLPPRTMLPKRDSSHHRRKTSASTESTTLIDTVNVGEDASVEISSSRMQNIPCTFEELYVLTRQISTSNDSSICECIHRMTGQNFCVKIFNNKRNNNWSEINLLSSVIQPHSNVVKVHEILYDYRYNSNNNGNNINNNGMEPSLHNSSMHTNSSGSISSVSLNCLWNPSINLNPEMLQNMTPIRNASGKVYMVMECMDGNLLSHIIQERQKEGDMDEFSVKKLAVQLLVGMQHLHETCRIQHGDIQPSNLLLGEDGVVKFADFGSAVLHSTDYNGIAPPITVNNPAYVAPELVHSQQQRRRSMTENNNNNSEEGREDHFMTTAAAADMWSLGVVIFFMLTGYSPFDSDCHRGDENVKSSYVLRRIQRGEYSFPPHLSRHAKQFLSNCLNLDPTIRFTASEALQHIWVADAYRRFLASEELRKTPKEGLGCKGKHRRAKSLFLSKGKSLASIGQDNGRPRTDDDLEDYLKTMDDSSLSSEERRLRRRVTMKQFMQRFICVKRQRDTKQKTSGLSFYEDYRNPCSAPTSDDVMTTATATRSLSSSTGSKSRKNRHRRNISAPVLVYPKGGKHA